jgi:zinc protease
VRSLPAEFETSGNVNATTSNIYIYDLPLDYYAKLGARISAVDVPQVRAVAQKYLGLDKMIVIAVGDRAKIAGDLQKLSLGAPEIRNADGTVK